MTNDRKYLEQFKRFQSVLALALMVIALALMTDKFLHGGQQLERAAADLRESLPLHRHDDHHPVGWD
jgi:hypothetical protein